MHEEVVTRDMVPAFVKLLKDTEAEVRTAIAGQIPGTIPFLRLVFLTTRADWTEIRLLQLD